MRAVISYQNLEKGLGIVKNNTNFVPVSLNQLTEYLVESYNKLIAKIYLAEATVINLFVLSKETGEDGELETGGIGDFFDAINRGYYDLADVINSSIFTLKFNETKDLQIKEIGGNEFCITDNEKTLQSFLIDKSKLTIKDFIILRQEFFERLNTFNLLEAEFLEKIINLLKTKDNKSIKNEDFINIFKRDEDFNLVLAYTCIFFVIESISGVKKNWIF